MLAVFSTIIQKSSYISGPSKLVVILFKEKLQFMLILEILITSFEAIPSVLVIPFIS